MRYELDKGHRDMIFAQLFPVKPGRGEYTKMRIVEAAIECLGSRGIEALTYESVAQKLGISRSQVKYHFPDLELLIDKAIDFCIMNAQKCVVDRLELADLWQEEILAVIEAFFDWAKRFPEQASVVLFFYYSATYRKRHRELHTRMTKMGFDRFTSILESVQDEKGWSDSHLEWLSLSIWALCDACLVYLLSTKAEKDSEYYRNQVVKAVTVLLEKS